MSNMHNAPLRVALAQAAPFFLDRAATLEKACELIVDAGHAGARLIVFPAAFLPGYPAWIWAIPPNQRGILNELYAQLLANAVSIPGGTTDRLCRIAQRARIHVVMGLTEHDTEADGSSCYNTLLYIDARGQIVGKHRSLVLLGAERLIWAQGDGSTLQVHKLPFGTISGLIGAEHYMPLARYALYARGTQIYIASAWDHGEPWLSTLRHIAKEGRVFVLNSGMLLHANNIPDTCSFKVRYPLGPGVWLHPGESMIINPGGEIIAGPLGEQEGLLYADIDLQQVSEPKWMLNVAGHDARPDVFQLIVHQESRQ